MAGTRADVHTHTLGTLSFLFDPATGAVIEPAVGTFMAGFMGLQVCPGGGGAVCAVAWGGVVRCGVGGSVVRCGRQRSCVYVWGVRAVRCVA